MSAPALRSGASDNPGAVHIMQIRDKAFTKHKRRFANYVLSVLSLLFNW